MQKLFETIKIVNGQPQFLAYHNQRFNTSRKALFQVNDRIDLSTIIRPPARKGVYRCRIIYTTQIESIEYLAHCTKPFKRFKIVEANELTYDFKYADRSVLNVLVNASKEADDILITKNGQVMDTSIANIAIWKENSWLTPKKPLLKGTTRARLLQMGYITEDQITVDMLIKAPRIAIMNALIDFHCLEEVKFI